MLDAKRPTIINPLDYREPLAESQGGVVDQAAIRAEQQTRPEGGVWCETFYFAANAKLITPLLLRRGAGALHIILDRPGNADSLGLGLFVPTPSGLLTRYVPSATGTTTTSQPLSLIVSSYSSQAIANSLTSIVAPIPSEFKVALIDGLGGFASMANAAWLRIFGLVL